MTYTIDLHKHRFAAWSASTAARASKLCRFNVETGVRILEDAGFSEVLSDPNSLPGSEHLDEKHLEWREKLIEVATRRNVPFTHGVAAKIANTYLKVRFVCGGHHEHPNVMNLHPPIDRVLLDGLAEHDVGGFSRHWRRFRKWGWSNYSSEQYQQVIDHIRRALPDAPLWSVEKYWKGHQ